VSIEEKLVEFTDALNRNTARQLALEEATIRLYDRLGDYLVALQQCTREITEARVQMTKGRWRR